MINIYETREFLSIHIGRSEEKKKGQINTTDYDCHKYINVLND